MATVHEKASLEILPAPPISNSMASNGDNRQRVVESSVAGPRIILGLDYGTTNTGLAWAQTDGQKSLTPADVIVFRDWPGRDEKIVLSAISYSSGSSAKKCRQWGWSIDDNSKVLRWTKLEFEHRTIGEELEVLRELIKGLDLVKELQENEDAAIMNNVPRHISKSAEDIVRDYLGKVSREWYQYMTRKGKYTLKNVSLDIVLTHPATWSYEAMNKTYRAVIGAFPKAIFPTLRDISFTSEPEAWALYTVQDMLKNDHNTLIPGECFVLCDAGGGTVDLVSYRINRVEPLELTRVGGLSGDKCGATFIDRAFLEWLLPRLENLDIRPQDFSTGGHMVLMPKGRVLLERFEKVKHLFNGTGDGQITLPRGTIVAADYEDSIINGVLTLTEQDLKMFFEVSVKGTLNLIARQITQVENLPYEGKCPYQVTNIFLAGGFSESEYLFNKVKIFADSSGYISVQRADDCWVGIAKGAVLRGIGIGMTVAPKVKACPRHYGICVSHRYEEWRHDSEEAIMDDFHGGRTVRDQLFWPVKQGDLILPNKPIVATMGVLCKFTQRQVTHGSSIRVIFAATDILNAPSNLANLPRDQNQVVDLDISLKSIDKATFQSRDKPNGGRYLTVQIEVEIQVSHRVDVSIKIENRILETYDTTL
jgi:hypothetical protein